MNKIRKLFRGSGRILGLIFAASIIWLVFDMAALRFSFTEINSKLSRGGSVRRERLRSKGLQDEEGLHEMFRRRPGAGGVAATFSRQPGGFGPRTRADALHPPAIISKGRSLQPAGRAAAGRATVAHRGRMVSAGPAKVRGAGAGIGASLHGVNRTGWAGKKREHSVKAAESKGSTERAGTSAAAVRPTDGSRGSPPGGEAARRTWTPHRAVGGRVGSVLIDEVWREVRGELGNIADNKVPVGDNAGTGVKGKFGNIADNKVPIDDNVWTGVKGKLGNIADNKVLVGDNAGTGVKGKLGNITDNKVPVGDNAGTGVKGKLGNITDNKVPVGDNAGTGVKGKLGNITDNKIPVGDNAGTGVKGKLGNIADNKVLVGDNAGTGVRGELGNITDNKVPVGDNAGTGVRGKLANIADNKVPVGDNTGTGVRGELANIADNKVPVGDNTGTGVRGELGNITDNKVPVGDNAGTGVRGELGNITDNKVPVDDNAGTGVRGKLANIADNKIPVGGNTGTGVRGKLGNIADNKVHIDDNAGTGVKGQLGNITDNKIRVGDNAGTGVRGKLANIADNKVPVGDNAGTGVKGKLGNITDNKVPVGNNAGTGVRGKLANIADNKIPVGDNAGTGVKGKLGNIADNKFSVRSKIWKGTPGELVDALNTKNVGLKLNTVNDMSLINLANGGINFKTAINNSEYKHATRATEKRGFSVNLVKNIIAQSNATNDQRTDGNVSKRSVVDLESAVGVHRVLSIDRTLSPRDPEAAGQFGQPAAVPKEQEERAKEKWKEGHFNVHLSNMIPLDRGVPDTRPKGCPNQMVHNNLPTTSIILCFVDEVWSTLLRSVHSIFNRSPAHLIKEVILVDDFSTREYLKENLDKYMSQFPKVHVIHLQERHGLIRARLVGAANATGDVLTFLDSHVECNVGWLEPLLERIHLKRTKVACPVIEVISDEDMSYIGVNGFLRGVFTWPMNFGWKTIPDEIIKKHNLTEMDPIKCPIMAGGLFSIDKKYFYELGTYDTGLEVWGGENMELSFKLLHW
ncbi:uncharacterized protein [Narcine bancroftii]|uniref:uncharacterized protein isoform X2 n=1 Tax=Narcine bancroftii TaxID=1343680 RepID=UPI0038316FC2